MSMMSSDTENPTTEIVAPVHADSDDRLLEIWLHGRSPHTQRAYRADVEHFLSWSRKPLLQVTLADLQQFADSLRDLAPASRTKLRWQCTNLVHY